LYDNIILFAPAADRFGTITFEDIMDFSNDGGNVLLAVNHDASDSIREFLESFGVSLHRKGSSVVDHIKFDSVHDISLQHLHVLTDRTISSKAILGTYLASNRTVLFHGVGMNFDHNNMLALSVLQGNPTTYSTVLNKPIGDNPDAAGTDTVMVGAIQARNNARITVSGSIDMFTNDFFGGDSGNQLFCTELSKWAFAESGVLRFRDIKHHKSDGSPPDVILHEKDRPDQSLSLYPDPEITRNSLVYRIKDQIVYTMIVEEYSSDEWKPFVASDMQMEFVMLDPYVRKTMAVDTVTGKYTAEFIAPDSYGVFKFRVLYRRRGYSVLHAETQVSIRPFKHDEYERFIYSAFPYYASALSATIAFFLFTVLFIFSDSK